MVYYKALYKVRDKILFSSCGLVDSP